MIADRFFFRVLVATRESLKWSLFSAFRMSQKKKFNAISKETQKWWENTKKFASLVEIKNQHVLPSNAEKISREENQINLFFLSTLSLFDSVSLFGDLKLKPFFESLVLEGRMTRNNWFQKPVICKWRFWSSDRASQYTGSNPKFKKFQIRQ